MAREKKSFIASILSEDEALYYGDCNALTVPTQSGAITILPYHTPIIAKLVEGEVVVHNERVKTVVANIKSGLLCVDENIATVLTDL